MAHDVFISYSSKDKAVADGICATLEGRRIRCWVAPRDVLPGVPYGEALIDGLGASRLLVLVFSSHSNVSPQVAREVERAVSKGIPIIPFRIETVPMSKSMEYFISSPHWLDALTPPLEKHLAYLADTVSLLLTRLAGDAAAPHGEGAPPQAALVPKLLSVGTIDLNQEQFTQQHFSEHVDIRFSITNLTDHSQKVPALLLHIHERRESDRVRLKKAGAIVQEFRLWACIDERETQDLFADLDGQEVLERKTTDFFRLKLEGAEGMHYRCSLVAEFHDLETGVRSDVASPSFEVEYPIRTLETLRQRRGS
jgi:hypothetical protein